MSMSMPISLRLISPSAENPARDSLQPWRSCIESTANGGSALAAAMNGNAGWGELPKQARRDPHGS
jgi:hypothetical protein